MKKFLIRAVRLYQRYVSQLKPRPTCRFYPTCSEYAALAIDKHGAVKGLAMSMWRVLRCNPWNPGGVDWP